MTRRSLQERFDRYHMPEPNSGCWLWLGAASSSARNRRTEDCRPRIRCNGKACQAHRVSYELHKGVIPDGLLVCHRCDNAMCVNPEHLWLGTHQDNSDDKLQKGRERAISSPGEANGRAVLTEADAISILADQRPRKLIAKAFGVSAVTVGHIQRGYSWKHLSQSPRALEMGR